ncbi:MAG: glycosyltransferase [Clostridia bacterium]|nr:glycosyltransferase [Clostridia bacterium]
MEKIAVLIPCYNEAKTIEKVVKDFKKELPEATIYVYDNNSKDGTDELARKAGAVVRYETRQGKGNVIRTMFREIDAECYIIVDGDDTYPAESAREIADAVLNEKVDMVIGDRLSSTYFTENKRLFHNSGNKTVRALINRLYKSDIRDILTGYRGFSYNFVKTFPIMSKGFEIETEMSIHALDKNMKLKNVIVDYRDRPADSPSKLNTIPDGIKVIKTIFGFYKNYKPMNFFGILCFLAFAAGLGFFIPAFIGYLHTGLVRIPTLLVSVLFFMASLQSLFTGLTLDNIIKNSRQNFEMRLIDCERNLSELKKQK